MSKPTPTEALQKAVESFKTLKAFSDAMNVRYQVVQQWMRNGVPAEYCPTIELVTQRLVLCEDLRPDVNWAFIRAGSDRRDGLDDRRDLETYGRRATDQARLNSK